MQNGNYYSIIEAISDLQARGFTLDFSLIGKRLLCAQQQRYLKTEEFKVREMYRFRAGRSRHRATIVYALESNCQPLKGILLRSWRR